MKTPAYARKEGQNPKGGLNAKGRASSAKAEGMNLKPPVKSGDNPRRASLSWLAWVATPALNIKTVNPRACC
jgi:hypothetical protein